MREIDHKAFADEYKRVTKANDYMKNVRALEVGDTIAVSAIDKDEASRRRHNIITDASNTRKRGEKRKYQTVIMSEPIEVWVRRSE